MLRCTAPANIRPFVIQDAPKQGNQLLVPQNAGYRFIVRIIIEQDPGFVPQMKRRIRSVQG